MQTPEKPVQSFLGPDGQTPIVRSHRAGCTCDECQAYQSAQTWQQLEQQLLSGRKSAVYGTITTQHTSR